jgi:TP901 family phage tail tape measure protein
MVDDVNANIGVNIDTSSAIASLKNLQREISLFHTQMARGGATANAQAAQLQSSLLNAVNATGQFQASMTRVNSTTEAFTTALEKNKLTMGQYFRYAGGASKTFGRAFKSEFDTISKVAAERVKDLQTQYISMGRDANGALQSIKIRPLSLDMDNLATRTMVAAQKQQLFNQLLTQGSTNLLNFGKNTQWAGRQLMVGFTVPLTLFATSAAKSFMEIEKQVIKIRRVYGDFNTTVKETDDMIASIKTLAGEYTKYGIEVEKTIGLASEAAAAGKTGQDLLAQVSQATRLAVLGNVEQSQALETTMSITNAFGTATEQLASKIDFLNAVENQSVTSIEDLTEAIPKAGPVVQQLGGDVEDLAFFLTAMKEGGINASEGANALKSGLAALINPTGKAKEMLQGFGINIEKIVESNKGDIKGLVIDFASALDTLDPLNRARAIEQLFGKFQFSRLSTLFQNVIGEGTQASRVLELTKATTQELAILSQRELKKVEDTTTYKFEKAFADFQAALAPVGESFLKAVTPVIEFGTKLLNQFNSMGDGAKNFTVILTTVVAGIGPVLLMTVGLVANGVANLIKMFQLLGGIFKKTGVDTGILGTQTDYMTQQQIEAAAVAASLNQSHSKLTQTFSVEAAALNSLTAAYQRSITAQRGFGGGGTTTRSSTIPKKYANGVVSVPGPKGRGDIVPAMLSPGEAVIPTKMAKKYGGLINGMIAGNIPGYLVGKKVVGRKDLGLEAAHFADPLQPGSYPQAIPAGATALGNFTMDVPREINQLMKAGGVNPDDFEAILSGIKKKIFATAEGAAKRVGMAWDESTQKIAQEIEDEIVAETARIAREAGSNVKDVHGAEARKTVLGKKIAGGRKAAGLAKAMEAEANIYGGYRTDNAAAAASQSQDDYFRKKYAEGSIERKGKTFYDKQTGSRVARFNWGTSGTQTRNSREQAFAAWEASGGKPEDMPSSLRMRSNSSAPGAVKNSFETRPTQAEIVDPKAVAKAKEIGKKTTKAQQDALNDGAATQAQTNSPSKVTRKIGQDTAQGYIDGVQSGVAKAEKTGRTSGRRVTKATGGPIVVDQTGTQILPGSTRKPRRSSRPAPLNQNIFTPTSGISSVPYGPAPKKPGIGSRIAKSMRGRNGGMGGMGVGMGLSGAGMVAGMMGNEGLATGLSSAGNIAMAVSGIAMLIPMLKSFTIAVAGIAGVSVAAAGAVLGLAGAFGVLAFLAYQHKEEMKKIANETKAQVDILGASRSSMEKMAEAQGKVLPSDVIAQQRADAIAGIQRAPGEATTGETYLTTEAGIALTDSVQKATKAGLGRAFTATLISQQLAAGISNGIISNIEATSISDALAAELKDSKLGVDIRGNLVSLMSSDGTNAFEKGLDLKVNLIEDVTKTQTTSSMNKLSLTAAYSKSKFSGAAQQAGLTLTASQQAAALGAEASILQQRVSVSQQAMDALTLQRQKDEISQEEYEKGRAEILKAGTAAYKQNLKDIKRLSPEQQTSVSTTLGTSITDMFKGTPMEAFATLAASNLDTLDLTTKLTIQTAIASGSLTPTAFNNIFDTYQGDQKEINAIINLDTIFGSGTAELVGQLAPYIGETGVITLNAFLNAEGNFEEGQQLLDIMSMASAAGADGINVSATLRFVSKNGERVLALWDSWEGMSDEEKTVRLQFETNGFKMTAEQWSAYSQLPDYQQKVFVTKYVTEDVELKAKFTMGGVFNLNAYEKARDSLYSSAMSAAISTPAPTINDSTNNNASGGGGGTPEDAELARLNDLKDKQQKALNVIALKEDAINKIYDKRKKALEDIAKLNQKIAEGQKTQLTIAEALSSGDISAAARAVQDARAKASQYAEDQQMQALEKKRQMELDGIIVNGKTKEAYEAEIAKLNLQIAERELALANAAATPSAGGSGGGSGNGSGNPLGNPLPLVTGPGPKPTSDAGYGKYWSLVDNSWKAIDKPKPGTLAPGRDWFWNTNNDTWSQVLKPGVTGGGPAYEAMGGLIKMAAGGMVMSYFSGGGSLGSDTIPAMLTPGEFVVKRPAVQSFGVKNLEAINSGKSANGSVYNYSVTVNASTGANADEIARTVISRIKQVDGQKLRGNRY